MIFILIPAFLIIGLMDLPRLIHNKLWPDLAVYSVLFTFALTLSVLLAFGVTIPSSTLWFEHIIKDVLHLNYS